MIEDDIIKLMEFIKQDFGSLLKGIQENRPILDEVINYIKIGKPYILSYKFHGQLSAFFFKYI